MKRVEIEIPARSPYVGVVRLALASLARNAGLGEETVDDLKIATSEACSNAVLAEDESPTHEPIHVAWIEEDRRVLVEVLDRSGRYASHGDNGGASTRLAMSRVLLESLVDGCEIEDVGGAALTRLIVLK